MKYDTSYLDFIAKYHPKYYSDDRVLLCDILFRYLSDDKVLKEDLVLIEKDFKTKDAALQELKRLERTLFAETLNYYYNHLGLSA